MQSANHKFNILELLFCFVLRETWGVTMLSERISCHSKVWCHNYYQRIMQSFKNDPYMKQVWILCECISIWLPINSFEIYHRLFNVYILKDKQMLIEFLSKLVLRMIFSYQISIINEKWKLKLKASLFSLPMSFP